MYSCGRNECAIEYACIVITHTKRNMIRNAPKKTRRNGSGSLVEADSHVAESMAWPVADCFSRRHAQP